MHPQVVEGQAGVCPICRMELAPARSLTTAGTDEVKGMVTIDPTVVQNMGVRVAPVIEGRLTRVLRLAVLLAVPAASQRVVSAPLGGRIERVYVDGVGARTDTATPLFDVSADGMGTRTIVSPVNGYVSDLSARVGSWVAVGQVLAHLVAESPLRLEAQAFQHQLPFLRLGQPARARFTAAPGQRFDGKVVSIAPHIDPATGGSLIRVELEGDTSRLRAGMVGSVEIITVSDDETVLVAREAIIDSGTRKLAFVDRGEGRFEVRELRVGAVAEERAQILSGLEKGESVVVSGQFLLDSESRLQQAITKYQAGPWSPNLKPKAALH